MESNWSLRNRLIRENPEMSNKDIAAATGYSVAYIGQVRRDKAYEEAAIQRRADKEQQKLDDYAAAAVAAEREACAKVCDEVGNQDSDNHAWDAAAAIRARSNQ